MAEQIDVTSYKQLTKLDSSINLDSRNNGGVFVITDAINAPTTGTYIYTVHSGVVGGVGFVFQEANNIASGAEYYRVRQVSGAWTAWTLRGVADGGGVAASAVSFIPSAYFGSATNVQDALIETQDAILALEIDVTKHPYSADPTGVADSRVTIQAALTAVGVAGGGRVYAPRGTYKISSPGAASLGGLRVPDNVMFYGDGMGITILKCADLGNNDMSGLVRTTSAVENKNIIIKDMTLDANKAGQTGWANTVPFFCGVTPGNRTLKDQNIWLINVEAINGRNGTAGSGHAGSGGYGFDPHEMSDRINFIGCFAHDNEEDGFVLDGCTNFIISGCQSYNNGRHGFNFVTQSENGLVTQSHSRGNASNNWMVQNDSNNITFIGGSNESAGQEGFRIRRGTTIFDTQIVSMGMRSRLNGREGVKITGAQNNLFSGGFIRDNGQTTNNTYNDVTLATDSINTSTKAEYNVFQGNMIAALAANKTKYAISETAAQADNNHFLYNATRGQLTGRYSIAGASSLSKDASDPAGATNLSYTASPTNGTVASDTGTDATLPLADGTNAGLLKPADFTKIAGIAAGADVNLTGAALISAIDSAMGSSTWQGGGGGGSPGGSDNQIQYNNGGAFNGTAGATYDEANNRLQAVNPIELQTSDPSASGTGTVLIHSYKRGDLPFPAAIDEFGRKGPLGRHPAFQGVASLIGGGSSVTVSGSPSASGAGTAATGSMATTSKAQATKRTQLPSAASASSTGGIRMSSNFMVRGAAANIGGYLAVFVFSLNTIDSVNTRGFIGISNGSTFVAADAAPSASTAALFGVGFDAAATTLRLMSNPAAGTPTYTDLGANFPVAVNTLYELVIYCKPNDSKIYYCITNLESGNKANGNLSSNLPASGTFMHPQLAVFTGSGTAAAVIDLAHVYVELSNW